MYAKNCIKKKKVSYWSPKYVLLSCSKVLNFYFDLALTFIMKKLPQFYPK